jgi:hypothetical protein
MPTSLQELNKDRRLRIFSVIRQHLYKYVCFVYVNNSINSNRLSIIYVRYPFPLARLLKESIPCTVHQVDPVVYNAVRPSLILTYVKDNCHPILLHQEKSLHKGAAYHKVYGGGENPLQVSTEEFDNNACWCPQAVLSVARNNHPLDQACSQASLASLMKYCNRPAEVIFVQHATKGEVHVTTEDLRDLLSHNKSIADETITLYLELLTEQCNLAFLATNTIPKLQREGWATVQRSFASFRNRRRTNTRPAMTGEPVLIIPCFVDGCHWVTVVCREVRGQVMFFFADDLNSPRTAQDIKQLLSTENTSNVFSPPGSQWIVCKNYTYTPHSNECGPR